MPAELETKKTRKARKRRRRGEEEDQVGPAVNFQEVVHSIRTGNSDVAKPQ
jgi:hypothetical protein